MARVGDVVDAAEQIARDAARWYADNEVPQAFRGLHPRVLATVRRLSGGDWQRCVVDIDGSVVVHNSRQWHRTKSE